MALIQDGRGGANYLAVDATSNAAHVTEYDPAGNVLAKQDKNGSITPGTTYGIPLVGNEYKTPALLRVRSDGSLITGDHTLLMYDNNEGAAVNTNKWIQTNTSMTIAQTGGVITYNNSNLTTLSTGSMQQSHRLFYMPNRGALVFHGRFAFTGFGAHSIGEIGFGSPTSATSASLVNGAVWRMDTSGNMKPVLSINGTETVGTSISNATFIASIPNSSYGVYEIVVEDNHVSFSIYTSLGVLVSYQNIDQPAASTWFQQTHLQALARVYNDATGGTSIQLLQSAVSIWTNFYAPNKPWNIQVSGQADNFLTSPTGFTQLANYPNSTAPVSATLSNTAAGYTTLGGQWQFAAVAGAETDYALFVFTIPSPYTFYMTGITIDAINTGAAVATTNTTLQWGLGFNSNATSLATAGSYPYMRVALGYQTWAIGAAIGAGPSEPPIKWTPGTPVAIFPGRTFAVIVKSPLGTATASQVIRGTVVIDGWFE